MPAEFPSSEVQAMSPEEAFDIVGEETRLRILEVLAEAEAPLSYSDLQDRVDYDSTNFHYHLEKLDGHFIRETGDGYSLQQAGGRIVTAILAGTVTEYPVLERTAIETPCFLCGEGMEMSYQQEMVALFCSNCGGTRAISSETTGEAETGERDLVGSIALPPSGIRGRTCEEMVEAAEVWSVSGWHALTRNVCPFCAATLAQESIVCTDHDASDGHCQHCDQRFAISTHVTCTNCLYETVAIGSAQLLGNPDVMTFMLEHGIDPMRPEGFHLTAEESIDATDPLEARFTFHADDEALIVEVREELSVTNVSRHVGSTDDAG